MFRKMLSCSLAAAVILLSSPCFAEDTKWDDLIEEATRVFDEMTMMPEDGIPSDAVKQAYAIAIFPSVVGGGFVFGGKFGQGIVVTRDKKNNTWSAPAVFDMGGASFGWQIGGQATDTILIIRNERGLDGLLRSNFKLGGDASIAGGPWGREAEATTDLQLKGMIWSYSRSRGAFIGAKLDGAIVSANKRANEELYGDECEARDILMKGKVKPPRSADGLYKLLKKF
jgi:lipid-binding SYLF domain-containing protein